MWREGALVLLDFSQNAYIVTSLDQMYKLYVRPHLDYGDVVYHNQNSSLMSKLESTQYAAVLAVSGAWRGTNTDKLFEELS